MTNDSAPDNNDSKRRSSQHHPKPRRRNANCIRTLRKLPSEVFGVCVRRLLKGDTASDVADWVMKQPDRGGCSHLSQNTLRFYLLVLRYELKKLHPNGPKDFRTYVRKTADAIHQQQVQNDNVVAIDAAITSNGEGKASPPATVPAVPERPTDPSEQKLEDIELEVEKRLSGQIRPEEFIVRDLLINRERARSQLKLEMKLGLPMKVLTDVINSDAKLTAQLIKLQSASEGQNQALERWSEIEKVDETTSSAEEKKFRVAVSKLTPADYDQALRTSKVISELIDLQLEEQAELKGDETADGHTNE